MNPQSLKIKNLYLETFGEGKPLICLHGGMGMDMNYLKVPGILDATKHGYQVILLDQRGNGRSEELDKNKLTINNWASDIDLITKKLGLSQTTVLGHSYGGMIAIRYASQQPKELSRLILVGTAPYSLSYLNNPDADTFHLQSDTELKEYIRTKWKKWFAKRDDYPGLLKIFNSITFKLAPYLAGKKELVKYDAREEITKISVPTTLILGEKYKRFVQRNKEMQETIPNSSLEIIKSAGHFPFIDQPVRFLELIVNS